MLITKLNQLLNNGEKTVEMINMNSEIKEDLLFKLME